MTVYRFKKIDKLTIQAACACKKVAFEKYASWQQMMQIVRRVSACQSQQFLSYIG